MINIKKLKGWIYYFLLFKIKEVLLILNYSENHYVSIYEKKIIIIFNENRKNEINHSVLTN